jgi:O-methyltransferase
MNFELISAALVLVVLILLVRYAWGIFFDTNYRPVEWENARKQGLISKQLDKLERNYPDKVRFFNWWFQVERLKRDGVPGDFAELGVYKGESARIIHTMDPARKFHLYDTFEGFKEEDLQNETGIAATYTTSRFADTSLEAVRRFIDGGDSIVFHPGRFPGSTVGGQQSAVSGQQSAVSSQQSAVSGQQSADHNPPTADLLTPTADRRPPTVDLPIANWPTGQLSLVNLDADLYNPTKKGLEYFYPRLSPGGVIIVHDYNFKWPGIKKAVDEFVSTIPERPVMVPDMEGSVMIVRSLF